MSEIPAYREQDVEAVAQVTAIQARQAAERALRRRTAVFSATLIVIGALVLAAAVGFLVGSVWASAGIVGLITLIVGVLMGLGN